VQKQGGNGKNDDKKKPEVYSEAKRKDILVIIGDLLLFIASVMSKGAEGGVKVEVKKPIDINKETKRI